MSLNFDCFWSIKRVNAWSTTSSCRVLRPPLSIQHLRFLFTMQINAFLSKVICVSEIKTGSTYVVIAVQTIATVDPPVQTSGGFSPSSPAARILIQSLVKSLLSPLPSIWFSTFPSSPTMLLFYLHCSPCWSFKSSRLWFDKILPSAAVGKHKH